MDNGLPRNERPWKRLRRIGGWLEYRPEFGSCTHNVDHERERRDEESRRKNFRSRFFFFRSAKVVVVGQNRLLLEEACFDYGENSWTTIKSPELSL